MSRYLLDTNVVSEAMHQRPAPQPLAWLAAQEDDDLFISAITLGELRRGALLLGDGRKRRTLLRWIDADIKEAYAERILAADAEVMERWAQLQADCSRVGRTLPVLDGLLAATALAHDLILATRNLGDFEGIGVPLLNPWEWTGS